MGHILGSAEGWNDRNKPREDSTVVTTRHNGTVGVGWAAYVDWDEVQSWRYPAEWQRSGYGASGGVAIPAATLREFGSRLAALSAASDVVTVSVEGTQRTVSVTFSADAPP